MACLSLDAHRDEEWCAAWLGRLRACSAVVGLLDLPVEPMILAWMDTGVGLRFARTEITVPGRSETALVFHVGDDEPVVLPVSSASAHALLAYAGRASSGLVTVVGDEPAEQAVQIALRHVLSEDAVCRQVRSPK